MPAIHVEPQDAEVIFNSRKRLLNPHRNRGARWRSLQAPFEVRGVIVRPGDVAFDVCDDLLSADRAVCRSRCGCGGLRQCAQHDRDGCHAYRERLRYVPRVAVRVATSSAPWGSFRPAPRNNQRNGRHILAPSAYPRDPERPRSPARRDTPEHLRRVRRSRTSGRGPIEKASRLRVWSTGRPRSCDPMDGGKSGARSMTS